MRPNSNTAALVMQMRAAGYTEWASRLEGCGKEVRRIECAVCGYSHTQRHYCHTRICPACVRKRARELREKYLEAIKGFKEPKLLTLTLKNSSDLERDKERIRSCFTKFRRRKSIASRLRGGLYAIESHPDKEGQWHTHIHAVVDFPYLPQDFLSRLWHDITGDSFIVDIRRAYSPERGLNYILKYLVGSAIKKGKTWTVEALVKFLEVVEHSRLIQAIGELLGFLPKQKDGPWTCPRCGNALWRIVCAITGEGIFDEVARLRYQALGP